MKIIPDSIPRLVHLLLLAELFVQTLSRPTHNRSLCDLFRSMVPQVDKLMNFSKSRHALTDEEFREIAAADHRLDSLPEIKLTATDLTSMKMNESVSQLYHFSDLFRLHVDWLKSARGNVSLPTQPTEGASKHLLQLTHLLNSTLHQIHEEVPQTPPLSLPVVSTAFDALVFSIEISEKLQVFCFWTKSSLRILQAQSHCPRR